jgi:hypothetical protein
MNSLLPKLERHVAQRPEGLLHKALATLASYRDEWLEMQGLRVDRSPRPIRQPK